MGGIVGRGSGQSEGFVHRFHYWFRGRSNARTVPGDHGSDAFTPGFNRSTQRASNNVSKIFFAHGNVFSFFKILGKLFENAASKSTRLPIQLCVLLK